MAQCRDEGRQGSASNFEKFLPKDVQFMRIIVHSAQKCLLTRAVPLAFGPGPRACWHCSNRSWWAAVQQSMMLCPCFGQPVLLLTAGASVSFVRSRGIFSALSELAPCALLHGEHRQPWLQGIILLVGGDASACLELLSVPCPGSCRAEGELCQNQPSSSSFPHEFLHCYLREECTGREVIIFNVCFNTYCICPSLFLHHLIICFRNYFPFHMTISWPSC